jgi:hypothetical protein
MKKREEENCKQNINIGGRERERERERECVKRNGVFSIGTREINP